MPQGGRKLGITFFIGSPGESDGHRNSQRLLSKVTVRGSAAGVVSHVYIPPPGALRQRSYSSLNECLQGEGMNEQMGKYTGGLCQWHPVFA